jgi:hypothetical protein
MASDGGNNVEMIKNRDNDSVVMMGEDGDHKR